MKAYRLSEATFFIKVRLGFRLLKTIHIGLVFPDYFSFVVGYKTWGVKLVYVVIINFALFNQRDWVKLIWQVNIPGILTLLVFAN